MLSLNFNFYNMFNFKLVCNLHNNQYRDFSRIFERSPQNRCYGQCGDVLLKYSLPVQLQLHFEPNGDTEELKKSVFLLKPGL